MIRLRILIMCMPLCLTGCMMWPSERFLLAAQAGNMDRLEMIYLENQIDVDVRDADGRTPVMLAAKNGHLSAILWLTERGADPTLQDEERWNALMLASAHGHLDVTGWLLREGLNLNLVNQYGNTALHWSVVGGHEQVSALLLERGANPKLTNDLGWTPAEVAAREGHQKIVDLFSAFAPRPGPREKKALQGDAL